MARRMLFKREDIGTEEDGIYLTRWILLNLFGFRLYLHLFRQSDAGRCLHDHPCGVWTLMLRGGYIETRPHSTRYYRAPSFRFFPAEHIHRIDIPDEYKNKTLTLCLFLPNKRAWGFWVKDRWLTRKEYYEEFNGKGGCDP